MSTAPLSHGEPQSSGTAALVCRALDAAPHGFAVLGARGEVLAVNRTLANWEVRLARDATQLLGSDGAILRALRHATAGIASSVTQDTLPGLNAGGPFRLVVAPFAPDGAVSVLIERRGAPALEDSDDHFRMLVEYASDGIAVHRDGVLLYVNPAALHMLGYSRADQLVGRRMLEIIHPDDHASVRERVKAQEQGVPAPPHIETFVGEGGRTLRVEVSASRAPLDDGFAHFMFFRDVAPRDARAARERAERFQSLGRLAGSIAHDFNNLVSAIQNSIALARRDASDAERQLRALATADSAAARARRLTERLMALGGTESEARSTDVHAVVEEAISLARVALPGPDIRFERGVDVGPVWIGEDPLHQVVMNLVMNACEAAGDTGHVVVRTQSLDAASTPERTAPSTGSWLRLVVEDDGPGIDAATLERAFEPFVTTKKGGTGLGLCTVYGIVSGAAGHVELQATGRGTRATVLLPQGRPQSGFAPIAPSRVQRVLVCDDEARLAALTAELLEDAGFVSSTATSADEAWRLLSAPDGAFAALLLDVNLAGGGSAAELLERMADAAIDVPVVLTSGYSADDVPEDISGARQVVGYVGKPYTVSAVADELRRAIAERRPA